ncbi:MAG: glycerophosphodiester phosphodiesterase [Acidobacteria bacterium]|nr:glycerophosphodiester phosphodiesterase [Acidobacteriota bacterium]
MRPIIFAHRGGAALAPENTMPAFDNGLACGADGIECDVHLSRDGVPMIMHDPTVDRTTNGTGAVVDLTAAELAALDAGYRFARDGAFPFRGQGLSVPTLRDVVDRYPRVPLLVELKSANPRLASLVVDQIRAVDGIGRMTVGSFHQGALDAVRACEPRIRTGADTDEIKSELTAAAFGSGARKPPFQSFQVPELYAGMRVVTREFITRAHDVGVSVIVWTVDREEDILRLLEWGVDGLITDRPDVAVPVVRQWEERGSRRQ